MPIAEFGNTPRIADRESVPSAVFSDSEAATVGLTEAQAWEKYSESVQCYSRCASDILHKTAQQDLNVNAGKTFTT